MQLSLLTRLARRVDETRHSAPSSVPGAWRDSATSQLDAIAAANDRMAAARLRRQAAWLATVGGVALLVSAALWRPAREAPRPMAAGSIAEARAVPVVARPQPAIAAAAPAVVAPAPPVATPLPQPTPTAVVSDAALVVASPPDEAARKVRLAQAAEVRRKAASQQAQERALADEDAQRERRAQEQQEQAERAQHQQQLAEAARERAAAAEQARRQAALLAQAPRRSVREACNASSFLGEQLCHARECRKAEHQGEALCVRLRDIELARLQQSADH
jgi:type IV secretory pathway VirB10-like protein